MTAAGKLALASLAAIAALAALLWAERRPGEPLTVLVAASLRPVLEPLAADHEAFSGRRVELRFGPSEQLMAQVKLAPPGSVDVIIPADESYLDGLPNLQSRTPLARMHAVALVAPSSSARNWAELTGPAVRHALAAPDLAAIGRQARRHLLATGRWGDLAPRIAVTTDTVTESANAVRLGHADAAIVWNVVARQHPTLRTLELPELAGVSGQVTAGVPADARDPAAARAFVEHLVAGRPRFAAAGFAPP